MEVGDSECWYRRQIARHIVPHRQPFEFSLPRSHVRKRKWRSALISLSSPGPWSCSLIDRETAVSTNTLVV